MEVWKTVAAPGVSHEAISKNRIYNGYQETVKQTQIINCVPLIWSFSCGGISVMIDLYSVQNLGKFNFSYTYFQTRQENSLLKKR